MAIRGTKGALGIPPELRRKVYEPCGVASNNAVIEEEIGIGGMMKTTLKLKSVNVGKPVGAANLAFGKKIFTFPSGAIIVKSAYMSVGLTNTTGNIDADTPDGGIGTVVASGAVAVLGGTGTFENILTGQTFNNVTGTAEVKTVADQILVIETGSSHDVFFNLADGWAGAEATGVIATGTVVIEWMKVA